MQVLIAGGGIGGLTLALFLHRVGISCRIFETAQNIQPLGLGVNLLPHSTKVLSEIGVLDEMAARAVRTEQSAFFNRFGQLIYREPAGTAAGYDWPQLSIHRGDVQTPLMHAVVERLGADQLITGHRCVAFQQDAEGVTLHLQDPKTGKALQSARGDLLVGADGIHSAVRKQLHPDDGDPHYTGYNMWRGASVWEPFLGGASMTRVGWMTTGKLVIYPIRNNVDDAGRQLINWVFELETPDHRTKRDWNKPGRIEDVLPSCTDWHFDWLDVPALLRASQMVLEFPMVDQDPLPWWTAGRVTLLGDAAHPMVPRGSNGAAQAIIDARVLSRCLADSGSVQAALRAYEELRLPATSEVVLTNRRQPPDAILREVFERTGDRPFANIDDVISAEELRRMSDGYKKVAGYDHTALAR